MTPKWFQEWKDNDYCHFKREIRSDVKRNSTLLFVILATILAGAVAIIATGG